MRKFIGAVACCMLVLSCVGCGGGNLPTASKPNPNASKEPPPPPAVSTQAADKVNQGGPEQSTGTIN